MVFQQSQKRTSVLQIRRDFSQTRNMTRINVGCTEFSEAFTFLMENMYVQFDGMVYQQIVGIPREQTVLDLYPTYFYIVTRGILCQTSRNSNGLTS